MQRKRFALPTVRVDPRIAGLDKARSTLVIYDPDDPALDPVILLKADPIDVMDWVVASGAAGAAGPQGVPGPPGDVSTSTLAAAIAAHAGNATAHGTFAPASHTHTVSDITDITDGASFSQAMKIASLRP